jgi:CARDB protein
MRILSAIETIVLTAVLAGTAYAGAPTGEYQEAVVQIIFSDETPAEHPLTIADLNASAPEMHKYYTNLSYGKLNFQIHFARVSLANTYSFYQTCGGSCDMTQDAVTAALAGDSTFLSGVKGVSVLVLNKYGAGDFTEFGPRTFSGVTGTFVQSLLSELPKNTVNPYGPSEVQWEAWSHEFGHQFEVYGGTYTAGQWKGHPSGYNSGYDEMDSCYPCGESSYGLLGSPLVSDPRTVFPGWLDSEHVATVPIPSGPEGATFDLPPITQNITTPTIQAVIIPIDSGRSYMVNVRMRLNEDALQTNTPQGIFSQGVQIQYTDVNGTYPVMVCVPVSAITTSGCTNTNGTSSDWPFLLWQVGQTFSDPDQNIQIAVVASSSSGFTVNITRDVPPGHPDLYITPWLTPPMNTYESVDIWVDSSCNGYGVLRYGKRSDGTVIGNGDDPCLNHPNRVYATVHNIGTADAPATTVKFQVTSPLGVGVSGKWTNIGTAALPAIAAGESATVYVPWTPTVNLTMAEIQAMRFQFHSCIQVIVTPTTGEIVTTNNSSQENFQYFEAIATGPTVGGGKFPMPILNGNFTLTSDDPVGNLQQFSLDVVSKLPTGWTYSINGGTLTFPVIPTETLTIPVQINPADSVVGQIYNLRVEALTVRNLNSHGHSHPSWYAEGGVVLGAHPVLRSSLTVAATVNPVGTGPIKVEVTGTLSPEESGAVITIDLYGPNAPTPFIGHATVEANGAYSATFMPTFAPTSVDALWQGNMTYSSVVATGSVTVAAVRETGTK